jgi:periplasmic protein CpxP/Spy
MKKFLAIICLTVALGTSVVLAQGPALDFGTDFGAINAMDDLANAGMFGGDREGRGGRGFGRRMMRLERLVQELELTEAQRAQMKQLYANNREAIQPFVETLRAKRQELRQLMSEGNFNEALVAQKLSEMAVPKAKILGEKVKLRQDFLAILTPEQKTKLEGMKQRAKSRFQERLEQRRNRFQ